MAIGEAWANVQGRAGGFRLSGVLSPLVPAEVLFYGVLTFMDSGFAAREDKTYPGEYWEIPASLGGVARRAWSYEIMWGRREPTSTTPARRPWSCKTSDDRGDVSIGEETVTLV